MTDPMTGRPMTEEEWEKALEAARVAVRDKWQQGCSKVCRLESTSCTWPCTCSAISELIVDAISPLLSTYDRAVIDALLRDIEETSKEWDSVRAVVIRNHAEDLRRELRAMRVPWMPKA